jgi:hypothetical protein
MSKRSIAVTKNTANRLKRFGIMGSTYDSILKELMDHADQCDSFWNRN